MNHQYNENDSVSDSPKIIDEIQTFLPNLMDEHLIHDSYKIVNDKSIYNNPKYNYKKKKDIKNKMLSLCLNKK